MRAAAMALAAGLATPMAWGQASIIEIVDPGSDETIITPGDLNWNGSVLVGGANLIDSVRGKAFRWTQAEGFEFFLDALGGADVSTTAYAVSADGTVIVGQFDREAFRWDGHEFDRLGFLWEEVPDLRLSIAWAVSADGTVVVGESRDRGGDPDARQAFRWTQDSGMVGLGFPDGTDKSQAYGTNDDGSIVVGNASQPGLRGWIWRSGTRPEILPFFRVTERVRVQGISEDGRFVVGDRSEGTPVGSAFRWSSTGIVDLGELPGDFRNATAFDASADGSVVVGRTSRLVPTTFRFDAFVWTERRGTVSVESELNDCYGIDLAGRRLEDARAVSGDGRVVAIDGKDADGNPAAYLVTIPIACRVDLDADGVLTIFDFLLFQNFFDGGDRAADFDCDGELTVFDFLAFQNAFAAGCP
ncbi:MAG: GC-type dockerin domain-anchored protein [Planctomycetota bacterium]